MNLQVGYYFGPVYRVEVMAIAKGYALVRYKGCVPRAVALNELGQMVRDYTYSKTPTALRAHDVEAEQ